MENFSHADVKFAARFLRIETIKHNLPAPGFIRIYRRAESEWAL